MYLNLIYLYYLFKLNIVGKKNIASSSGWAITNNIFLSRNYFWFLLLFNKMRVAIIKKLLNTSPYFVEKSNSSLKSTN